VPRTLLSWLFLSVVTSEIAVAMAAVAVSAVGTMEEGVAKKDWIYNSIQH